MFSKPTIAQIEIDSTIYSIVDVYPEFPGGDSEFYEFFLKNLQLDNFSDCDYDKSKIVVRFVVEIDGSLSTIEVLKNVCANDLEVVNELLQASPMWEPAIHNNKRVRSYFLFPIRLCLR